MNSIARIAFCFLSPILAESDWTYSCPANQYVWDTDVDLQGKTVLVTGSDGTLGFPLSKKLAMAGATLIAGSRTSKKAIANKAKLELESLGNITVYTMVADLSSFDSVRSGAADVLANHAVVDIIIHMAGTGGFDNVTADGFDGTTQVNHLSSALLTNLLLPALRQSPDPRVIYIGSANMYAPIIWKSGNVVQQTLQWIRGFPPADVANNTNNTWSFYYGLSKLLIAEYVVEQALRHPELTLFTVNPGLGRADAGNPTKYAAICDIMKTRPCPQFPAQAVTSTFFAATHKGIERASGSLIDFATQEMPISSANPFGFVQSGESCIPRPLPDRDLNAYQTEWYDAINTILDDETLVV